MLIIFAVHWRAPHLRKEVRRFQMVCGDKKYCCQGTGTLIFTDKSEYLIFFFPVANTDSH